MTMLTFVCFFYHYHYPYPYPDTTFMVRYLHDHHEGVYDIFINFLFFQCHSQYTSLDSEYCHLLLPRYVIYTLPSSSPPYAS